MRRHHPREHGVGLSAVFNESSAETPRDSLYLCPMRTCPCPHSPHQLPDQHQILIHLSIVRLFLSSREIVLCATGKK
jgi:hypothetical protein